jgi:ABC-type branched-subunit amino acid transport system substrate-binding protein
MKVIFAKQRILIPIVFASALVLSLGVYFFKQWLRPPIKLGILHSLTGTLAFSEKTMVDAELMAIDEINASGGILGRKIFPIVVDGKSDDLIFAQEAERLIVQEKVSAIVGCWTSSSRRAVKKVVEKYNNLLMYPITSEGADESSNVVVVGASQNQQIVPCALWSYYNLGKNFFLVGTEDVYSRVALAIIKEVLKTVDAQVLGEEYLLWKSVDVSGPIQKILDLKPDVIINTIQGDAVEVFFNELRAHGITPEKIPVMSVGSVGETEFAILGVSAMAGDYVTASYFQSIEREKNYTFVTNFKKRFGMSAAISDWTESAYVSVYLWANAVQTAEDTSPLQVLKYMHNRVINAPEGIVYTDNKQLNSWKMIYIGKLRSDGQFTIVWDSGSQVQPLNFPIFKEKKEWEQFINDLYVQWGNRWSKIE